MLRIRLRRMGTNKRPFYRIVVSDSRKTPSARVVDTIGHFDPLPTPKRLDIDLARVDSWIGKGALPSDTVADLIRKERARAKAVTA